jgi:hypothetical protein
VRTYAPYLDAYNSDDPTLDLERQEFTVPASESVQRAR